MGRKKMDKVVYVYSSRHGLVYDIPGNKELKTSFRYTFYPFINGSSNISDEYCGEVMFGISISEDMKL